MQNENKINAKSTYVIKSRVLLSIYFDIYKIQDRLNKIDKKKNNKSNYNDNMKGVIRGEKYINLM